MELKGNHQVFIAMKTQGQYSTTGSKCYSVSKNTPKIHITVIWCPYYNRTDMKI